MKTGLVSYKLCDRNYNCETCPFDRAMKNGGEKDLSDASECEEEGSFADDSSSQLEGGSILFHQDHCWVKVETHEQVRIGLDAVITMLISNVQLAVLPVEGSFAKAGECFAHIIQEDYVLPVISPLSGVIIESNYRLRNNPRLITSDPKGNGWLVTIKPDNLENDLKKLFFGRKAQFWRHREENDIANRVHSLMRISSPRVGPTMQDGGTQVTNLHDLLSSINSKQLVQILDSVVSRRKES
jgi:glycine cleavage system H protein